MGGEYPKGGGRYSWGIRPSGGVIFLGYSSPGGESPGGTKVRHGQKSILPPPKYEFAPQMPPPPNSEAWRRH
jgi:hypothetical protein